MDPRGLKAIISEEEYEQYMEESLEGIRRLLRAEPERFCMKAAPVPFPERKKMSRREKEQDALRAMPKGRVYPTRLPWELLPKAPEKKKEKPRTVYQTLPAQELIGQVRAKMRESKISVTAMAEFLHVAPGTFRRWERSPEYMTVRDYGALAAWLNGERKGGNGVA